MDTVSCCASLEITPGCCHKGLKLCGYSPCLAFGSGGYEAVVRADKLPDVGELLCLVYHPVGRPNGLAPTAQSLPPVRERGVGIHFRGQGRERISPCTV